MNNTPNIFPTRVAIEDISVEAFADKNSFYSRLLHEISTPHPATILNLNVHASNLAHKDPALKQILQDADLVYCDGMGIVLASRMLDQKIPSRFAMADLCIEILTMLKKEGKTVFFLGGKPGIAEKAVEKIAEQYPDHPIVGSYHGYFLNDPAKEQEAIEAINKVSPSLVFVCLGMPLQERWIDQNKHRMNVGAFWASGGFLDHLTQVIPRCPIWLGDLGFEWLWRLYFEPARLFNRYVVGNPWFLTRIALSILKQNSFNLASKFSIRKPV